MTVGLLLLLLLSGPLDPPGQTDAATPAVDPARYEVQDTFDTRSSAAADDLLAGMAYDPITFTVVKSPSSGPCDRVIRFPSPKPRGDERNDTVVLEWTRAAREVEDGPAPAMLVLHILDGRMRVARSVASAFSLHGIHAFVMHMPDYGERGDGHRDVRVELFEARTWQAVADARRARDVIASLPGVDGRRIGLQGTSLGGFTGSLAASVDGSFDPVLLVLAGGDLPSMFEHGGKDTAKIRARFEAAGVELDELKTIVTAIDPARLAHRLDPQRTWLWSAISDQVVPAANARALGETAGLDSEHHRWMLGNHYTCAAFLPSILKQMTAIILGEGDEGKDGDVGGDDAGGEQE